jgi:MarR family transcriptional regulator for hemolysin
MLKRTSRKHRYSGYDVTMTKTADSMRGLTGPAALPGDLGWHLGMVLRGWQSEFETAVAGMPAGVRGFQVLSTVVHHNPPNQQALGAHLGIDRTVLTYLIDALVGAGVVERLPDPVDRRSRKVLATDKGLALLEEYETRVAAAETELLAGLPQADADALSSLIGRLAMNVHRAQPGTNPCEAMDHLP